MFNIVISIWIFAGHQTDWLPGRQIMGAPTTEKRFFNSIHLNKSPPGRNLTLDDIRQRTLEFLWQFGSGWERYVVNAYYIYKNLVTQPWVGFKLPTFCHTRHPQRFVTGFVMISIVISRKKCQNKVCLQGTPWAWRCVGHPEMWRRAPQTTCTEDCHGMKTDAIYESLSFISDLLNQHG